MASKEKSLIKNTLLFSIGNIGAKLLMLIIVPLYTYFVTVDQMGQYDVVNTYVALFAPFSCLAIHEGMYRWLLDEKTSNSTILKSGIVLTLTFVGVFDIGAFIILSLIKYQYVYEFVLLVTSQSIYTVSQFFTRGLRNNKIYAFQGIVYTLVLIACNLVMVIYLRMQAKGLLLSMIIAGFATTLYIFAIQRILSKYIIQGKFDKLLSKEMIKYSIPMVPNNVAWWLVAASNRLVINWSIGDVANGIYAIAMKFPTLVNMLSTFFYQAWQDQAISEYSSEERDAYYTKIFNLYSKLLLSGIVALYPVTKFIIVNFMDPSYEEAYKYVGFLYISGVLNAFAAFYGTGYLSTKKTGGAFTTTVFGAIANVVITFVLINGIALYAAAIGSMIANLIIWVLRIIQTRKYFCITLDMKALIMLFIYNVLGILCLFIQGTAIMVITEVVFVIGFIVFNKEIVSKILSKFISIKRK